MRRLIDFFRWAKWHYGYHLKRLFFEKYLKRDRKRMRRLHLKCLFGNPFREYRIRQIQLQNLRRLRKRCDHPGEVFSE